jgi:hypothetical protein
MRYRSGSERMVANPDITPFSSSVGLGDYSTGTRKSSTGRSMSIGDLPSNDPEKPKGVTRAEF